MVQGTDYLTALEVGGTASEITGNAMDAVIAGGFASFIAAITGTSPTIRRLPGNRAKLVLTDSQKFAFQKFLDTQVFASRKPSSLDLGIGPVAAPWAAKYAIPAVIAVFIAGWIANSRFGGR